MSLGFTASNSAYDQLPTTPSHRGQKSLGGHLTAFNPDPKLISHRFDRLRVRLWFDRFYWLTALRLSTGEDRGEAHSKSGPEVLEGKESSLMINRPDK